ncbi:hypothetical protein VNO77_22435 [Canavalia gladiata]|uniref:PB1 domain-containing protein n=1 Tax=Canavalia gladiata TaxID=3824 RepID=A0AAN9L3Z7_CANGL
MGDESPKNKVKFLCSHGGRVLPRPSDGLLKYVGGETRVVSVSRNITFSELMKKLSSMFEGEMVLKYQLVPEDLDALVSVRTEEDLKHMIEEHDRHQTSLLRAFLLPAKPVMLDKAHSSESYMLEQRYIDAVNGIIRTSPRARGSTSSTPKSTSPEALQGVPESPFHPFSSVRFPMHRVRSSPSLTNLNAVDHSHHHYPLAHSSRPPQDPQVGCGIGRPLPMGGKTDMMNPAGGGSGGSYSRGGGGGGGGGFNYYYSQTRPHKAYAYQEDTAPYGPVMLERLHSACRSPRKPTWD